MRYFQYIYRGHRHVNAPPMSPEIIALLVILGAVTLFVTEKLSIDLVHC
jgi:hypothetical protein